MPYDIHDYLMEMEEFEPEYSPDEVDEDIPCGLARCMDCGGCESAGIVLDSRVTGKSQVPKFKDWKPAK